MSRSVSNAGTRLAGFGHRWLPFADAASADLSLGRLLRLSLFQLSTGMAIVLLTGTLNHGRGTGSAGFLGIVNAGDSALDGTSARLDRIPV